MGNETLDLYGYQSFRQLAFPLLLDTLDLLDVLAAPANKHSTTISINAGVNQGRIVPLRGQQKGTGAVEFKQHRLTQAAERTVIDLTSVNPPGTFQPHRFGLLFPSYSVSRLELPPREDHINYTNQSETCCFISLPKTT